MIFPDILLIKDLQIMNFRIFEKSYNQETLEKVKSLAIEICSIPSMLYITGVKPCNRLSGSQNGM